MNVWAPPQLTVVDPFGEIVPCSPALAVIVSVLTVKLAVSVWFAVTFVNA